MVRIDLDKLAPEDMTSKEYYLDSTAHFAVHEVSDDRKKRRFVLSVLALFFRNY